MAKPRRVRWECPAGKHPAVLGSTRPLADATVRFCLPCSEQTGRLVKRTAPALERKRAAKTATAQERAKARRDRDRQRARRKRYVEVEERDGSVGEVDTHATMKRMLRLPAMRDRMRETFGFEKRRLPELTLRRRASSGVSAHAYPWEWRIAMTIGPCESRISVEELILHELVHLVCEGDEWHGDVYRRTLVLAAREWWPGITVRADSARRAYDLDRLICEQAREVGKGR